ncbi:two-component regulator propeller domain-containing protein [Pedobacter nyackensis]|uniref:ligand-binding sensor domain-containing protein n=1 Tax=Pedobacter nyackensis TaxID=475255 RepID=UPI002930E9CD|nr:two-component regulator propeller domain-containing protein [Pedobacter nyackensis]
MTYLRSIFVCLVFFICSTESFGQRYNFEQYDIQDGLIQSQVTAFVQDQQNRLWIATLGGLSCFDGNNFTNLGKTNGLNSNFLLSLTTNKQGSLIIGTEKGLSIYKNDSLYKYTHLNEWADKITTTSTGKIYGISGRNLFKVKRTITELIYVTGDSTEIVTALKTDGKGKTWVALYGRGLYYLSGNKWYKKETDKQIENLIITDLLIDNLSKDKVWLLTPGGVYIAEEGEIKKAFSDVIKKATAISQDQQGNIWLGTNSGAWFISKTQRIHFNAKNGFTDNVVNKIFKDRENNIWLGTDGSGIFKFNSKSYVTYDESQGLQNSIVMSIINGPRKGEIWLGTYNGIYIHKNNTVKQFNIPSDNEDAKRINFLFNDSSNNIWIGTVGGGLWIYSNNSFKRVDKENQSVACNAILEDRHKNIWISTNFGCFVLDRKTGKIDLVLRQFGTSVLEIGNNIMITGNQNGAHIIRNKKDIKPLNFKPLIGSSILSMLKYGDHVLFGTADNGLIIWNITTGKIKQISTKDGLLSDHIYSLMLDKKGVIWMGTGRGVNRLNAKNFNLLTSINDNALLVECNQNAIMENEGKIWIGTTKGALVYNNNNNTTSVIKPSIFINSVNVLPQNKKGSQAAKPTTYKEHELTKKIVLPYNHNHLNISFTGVYLTNPKAVMYQYRLKGLEDKYGKPGINPSANYTALPPGKYTFQVKAVTQSGVESGNTASFELEITPPYYQTTIFKVFIFCLILLLMMISVYTIINLNERQRKLRLKIKLEEQFKIRKQTAEDFHDDIGNKLTRISVLSEVLSAMTDKDDHEKRAIIQKVKTNVNELYNGTKDILWSLNPKNDTLGELLTHIKEFGCEMFDDTQISFEDETIVNDTSKRLPLELSRNILMIYKEAINNTLKYAKGDRVIFMAKMTSNILEIQLKDNGIGFNTSASKNGQGMNNMQVRARRIKGNLNIMSTNAGTTVALSVKL